VSRPYQFRCNAPVGFAEGDAFAHHQPVGLLGRMDRGVEADALGTEAHGIEGGRHDVECLLCHVDAAEYHLSAEAFQVFADLAGRPPRDIVRQLPKIELNRFAARPR
jgi:hypothetical protein